MYEGEPTARDVSVSSVSVAGFMIFEMPKSSTLRMLRPLARFARKRFAGFRSR
jgi:hypothetical protein